MIDAKGLQALWLRSHCIFPDKQFASVEFVFLLFPFLYFFAKTFLKRFF